MFTKTGALHADVPSAWDMAAPVPPLYLAWLLMFRGQNRSHAENEQKEGCEEHMRSCLFSFFLDSHPQNVFRQKCVQHFFVLSYLDKCWPPKSCGPTLTNHVKRRNPIFVYLHKGVVAVEQSALRQSRNAPVPANKMQMQVVYYILHRCIFQVNIGNPSTGFC